MADKLHKYDVTNMVDYRDVLALADFTPSLISDMSGIFDKFVKVNESDPISNYLENKLVAGTGVSLNEIAIPLTSELTIEINNTSPDTKQLKVSSNDATEGYLNGKLVADDGTITLTEHNDGAAETLGIKVNADHKVLVDAVDSTAQYLADKLVGGLNVTLDTNDVGGVHAVEINAADEKTKVSSDDTAPNWLDNKLTVDYTLEKIINFPASNENIELKLCSFAGLSGINLQSLNSVIAQDNDGVKRKIEQWQLFALSARQWVREGLDNAASVGVSDTTDTLLDLVSLDPTDAGFKKNKALTWGFDDTKARCLGRISTIGSAGVTYVDADFQTLHGSLLVVAANDYSDTLNEQCWFSLKLDVANTSDSFGLSYMIAPGNTIIDHVISATFQFNSVDARWHLIAFETLKTWLQLLSYANGAGAAYSYALDLPHDGTNLKPVPLDGYYHVDLDFFFTCAWTHALANTIHWDAITIAITDTDGTITPITTDSANIDIGLKLGCPAACCCVLSDVYNVARLRWSGIVHIAKTACAGRKIRAVLTFPATADATPNLISVRQSWHYLEKKLGHYCNEHT